MIKNYSLSIENFEIEKLEFFDVPLTLNGPVNMLITLDNSTILFTA
jgi:hypothetical protein